MNLLNLKNLCWLIFYADWCGPCKAMEPIVTEVAKDIQDKIRVVKVNIDKQVKIAQAYNVNAVPTFIFFKQGKIIWRHPGALNKITYDKTYANRLTISLIVLS